MESGNDNVYLNVTFNHNPQDGNGASQAIYNVTKSTPILPKCSDYYCSVIRFDIPLDMVPLFIMPIVNGQNDPNLSSLIIGMTDPTNGNLPVPVNVVYVPQSNEPIPPNPNPQQVVSPYYYVYSINHVIDMINVALASAWGIASQPGGGTQPPYFYYDPSTQLISLVIATAFTGSGSTIFMNNELATFLDGFQLYSHGNNNAYGRDFDFVLTYYDNNAYAPYAGMVASPDIFYRFTQEYNVIPMWCQLRKILILTNNIPVASEFVQVSGPVDNGQNVMMPIITDFVLSFNTAGESRSIAVYNPSSQYRLIDLVSSNPLQTIDLRVYWADRLGNVYPLTLSLYQQASVKIAFLSKKLYKI